MNKHPTPLHIRRERKQSLANIYPYPEMTFFYKKCNIGGYIANVLSKSDDKHITIEVYPNGMYFLKRPKVTVGRHKYVVAAAIIKLVKQDQIIWDAADAMCEALGLNPENIGFYPFGSQMLPTGVVPIGMGAYMGPVPPEQQQYRYWMYKHALVIKAAQEVFSGK